MSTAARGSGGDGTGFFMAFLVIWIIVCLGGIIYSMVNLASFKGAKNKPSALAIDVVEMENEDESRSAVSSLGGESMDFEAKLRKLEALRKDGILSEEEYQRKRKEILDQKW